MMVRAGILWALGLVTLVPYGTYYLLFEAPRDEYALLITAILFWIFGYWALVSPLIMALKVRSVFRAIESAGSRGELAQVLAGAQAKEVAVDLIARENGIPRFLAARVYQMLLARLSTRAARQDTRPSEASGSPRPKP